MQVAATGGVSSGWASVSAGGEHTCAIAESPRAAYCWGATQPPATEVEGGRGLLLMCSSKREHDSRRTLPNTQYCAGKGEYGQLGIALGNTEQKNYVPMAVAPTNGVAFGWASISAGGTHTCAIANSTRAAYCWGAPGPAPRHGGGGGEEGRFCLGSQVREGVPHAGRF